MNEKSELKKFDRKTISSYKSETLEFLQADLNLVDLEIKVERTKANFMKDKKQYENQLATVHKQLTALEYRQDQLVKCIAWLNSLPDEEK